MLGTLPCPSGLRPGTASPPMGAVLVALPACEPVVRVQFPSPPIRFWLFLVRGQGPGGLVALRGLAFVLSQSLIAGSMRWAHRFDVLAAGHVEGERSEQ